MLIAYRGEYLHNMGLSATNIIMDDGTTTGSLGVGFEGNNGNLVS